MSPRITLSTIVAALLLCAVGAPPALGATARIARAEAKTVVATSTELGTLGAPRHAKLGPAHRVDVGALRRIHSAKRGARRHPRAALPAATLGAKLLVLSPNTTDPAYAWWTTALRTEGVPFDAVVTRDTPITTALLQADATHGNYEGIVLTSGSLIDWSTGSAVQTMTADEWTALQAYERAFAVREIEAYDYPQPAFGTNWGGKCGDVSGLTATVTPAGAAVFSDLTGSFPVDSGVYGCQSTPLAGGSWQTLVSGPDGAIVGTNLRSDGVETMFDSFSGADWTTYTRLLVHGMLNWVTKGLYLGLHRDYFRIDVDDIFLANDRWDPATHALNPDDSSVIRMTPSDVLRAVQWQDANGIQFNLLYNGQGADPSHGKKNAGDALTNAILLAKDKFWWTSHTWSHPVLDGADYATIKNEIKQNIDFAKKYHLPFDENELVTGGHTGLTDPYMPQALKDTNVQWFGADNSRQPVQYALGNALSVPRWPTGVYYNVGTFAEELDEYNYLNYTVCGDGQGHGIGCLSAPVTSYDQFVRNEATMIVRHILDNDPRPHYVHQSNLAEDGTLYPVANEVLRRFHAYVNTPLVQLTMTQEGQTLQQQAAWSAALASGAVSGTITGGKLTVTSTVANLNVPVTGVRNGQLYGGVRSGWFKVGGGPLSLDVGV